MQKCLERASEPTAAALKQCGAVRKKTPMKTKTPTKPPPERARSIFVTRWDLAWGCLGSGLPLEGFAQPASGHTRALGRGRKGLHGSALPSLGVLLCMGWP